ncbi:MAG TPA: transposase [Symbiobacteriaceae bacterium]|nr:transposase [Symbiobacteriaceae bacterium]
MARRNYTPEFRSEAVRLVQESGKSPEEIAKNLGVAGETLRIWIRQHETDTGKRDGLTTTEREELIRLRKENRVLREEREILRKAAAFFAQEINKTS